MYLLVTLELRALHAFHTSMHPSDASSTKAKNARSSSVMLLPTMLGVL